MHEGQGQLTGIGGRWQDGAESQSALLHSGAMDEAPAPARPRRHHRPPMPPAVKGMLVINIAVYLAWLASSASPQLRRFMVENFLVSPAHILTGRIWTLLTSVFSHAELWHLLINMIVLVSFGQVMEWLMGTRRFLTFYLAAGVFASMCHCLTSALILGKMNVLALGASGALSAVVLVFALRFPKEKILVFGIIPIPALVGAIAFIGLDLWGLTAQAHGGGLPIGHGAHLGGAAFGLIIWFAWLKDRLQPPAPPFPRPPMADPSTSDGFPRPPRSWPH